MIFKCCNLLLFLGFSVNICVSAPAAYETVDVPSSLSKSDVDRLTIESNQLKTSLDHILSSVSSDSKVVSRQVTDAVVILQQVLKQASQNSNPLLSQAVINSLVLQWDHDSSHEEDSTGTMKKLQSFLNNLTIQITLANFPITFSNWLKNHIIVIQNFIQESSMSTATSATMLPQPIHHLNEIIDDELLKQKFENFKAFIQDGLQNLVRQETLNNIEVGKVNRILNSEEFDTALASIIDHPEEYNVSAESSQENYSLSLVQVLKQVYERASPDLQRSLQSVLKALERNGLYGQ